jgi:tripartite-type tricarboxylate transporter receptor subunit TctC
MIPKSGHRFSEKIMLKRKDLRSRAMRPTMRRWLSAVLLALFTVLSVALNVSPSLALDAYPSRLVKIVLPTAPGSTTDILARLIADQLSRKWGKPVIVENVAGGGMSIGTIQAFRAAPDGYTLFLGPPSPLTVMKVLYRDLPFEPSQFTPIALLVRVPNALAVRKDLPASNVKELIDYAKANPGKVTFGSQGAGSTSHLSANLIDLLAGTEMVHVPYRGAVPALNAVMAGQIDFFFDTVTTSVPQHRAGNVRIIAVGSTERSEMVPEAPPVAETLPGFRSVTWFAMAGPPGMPAELAGKINQDINESLARAETKERLQKLSLEPIPGTPADAAKFFVEETELWGRVIREKHITVQ